MAIDALMGKCLYTSMISKLFAISFVWLPITNDARNLPDSSKPCRWGNGSLKDGAVRRVADMKFEAILEEGLPVGYSPAKPLAIMSSLGQRQSRVEVQ